MSNLLKQIPTPHNEAQVGEIAKTVLMPGDPLRAKYIAETYLENVTCFNQVRGMLGFTGEYKGQKVSVMGSGMGMPSMGIYSFELFDLYGVENIIRIGSCGAYLPELKVFDTILATETHTESTFFEVMAGKDDKVLYPSETINRAINESAKELNLSLINAPIFSGDCFYNTQEDYYLQERERTGAIAAEMEAFALFANATMLGKNAACLLTVSDNIATHEAISSADRQLAFGQMMEIALNAAIRL
jgi:purine-nucleoside phosphorylase